MRVAVRLLVMMVCAVLLLWGCRAVTARVNRRAESHVKFHAARLLKCEEGQLHAECAAAFSSGECYEYAVRGCRAKASYRNLPGEGWTTDM